jgi:hypothetical protein
MEIVLTILFNLIYVFAFVSWLNSFIIHYIYVKFADEVEYTKDTVINQYCYSLAMTLMAIVILKIQIHIL